MNIFWEDRDGSPPPNDATFGCCPFFPESKQFLFGSITRVKNLPPPTPGIKILQKTFCPNKKEWSSLVTKAIQCKTFDKVVLARSCTLELETAPDPFAVAAHLRSKGTVFCFANENFAFLGASPELLFSRQGKNICSESVAGTMPRGKTAEEDFAFEEKLLQSDKIRSEFVPVQTFIQERLSPLCKTLSFAPPHIRKMPNVQHLCSTLTGVLRETISDAHLLKQLHPTPAICGSPTQEASQWIQSQELFDRNLYGSAIGWSTPQKSVWVPAIRCCLIQNTKVTLFTGAGIVALSNPQEEWEELEAKMALYKDIFI